MKIFKIQQFTRLKHRIRYKIYYNDILTLRKNYKFCLYFATELLPILNSVLQYENFLKND